MSTMEYDHFFHILEKIAAERGLCLEELIVAVCDQLKKRGLTVACVPDEDVIFYMPVVRADEGMRL